MSDNRREQPLQSARDNSTIRVLRQTTLVLGGLVAAFVPVMQILVDRALPELSKPVIGGVFCGLLVCGLCGLPRRWHLRFLLLTVMGLLTLCVAELVCSLLLRSGTASIYDWDDRCLYKPQPNSYKVYRRSPINGGQTNTVSINSQGYRGPELPAQRDEPRVIVYGDSFIEAEYSAWENTFGEQLRQATGKLLGRPITVINAGANGFGPDQALLRMEMELAEVRPDVVILSIFADNDCGDLLRNKLFRLDDRGNLVTNAWTRSPACLHPGLAGRYEPTLWKLARDAIRGVQSQGGLVESYMNRWLKQCQAEYDEYIVQRNAEVHDLQADHYDADIGLTPGAPSGIYKAALLARVLQRIDTACRQHGTQLLIMIIPSPGDLIENYDFYGIDRVRYPDYDSRVLTNLAAKAASDLKRRTVNLYEPFAKHNPSGLYFRGGDNHWNDAGQRLAAETVAPVLVESLKMR